MFVTPRDPGVRRRNRIYSNSKAARSSKLSLLSAFTVTTTSSGGSSSTVTQESYNRSQHRQRRKKPKDHRTRRLDQNEKNVSVDVFDFLVEEKLQSKERLAIVENGSDGGSEHGDSEGEEDGCIDSESESEPEPEPLPHPKPEIGLKLDDTEPEGYYRSMSDSGISMGSGSSSSSGRLPPRHLPVVMEEGHYRSSQHPLHPPGNELALIDPRWAWPTTSPQPYHDYVPPPCPPPPPAVRYEVHPYPYPPYTPYGTPPVPEEDDTSPSITIREPRTLPVRSTCFRSFAKISERLLLQMQDDLARLEDELKVLDQNLDNHSKADDQNPSRISQCRDWKRRQEEIYQELHAQLDNFYHALEMSQKIDALSESATKSDLHQHHAWLDSRIVERERIRHLVGSDLRRFAKPHPTSKPKESPTFQPQYLAFCCLINALIPLITFKLITGILNRFIFVFLAAVAGAIVQDRTRATIGRDELTCTLVCICVSVFAAMFL